jgi:hypothetical protein
MNITNTIMINIENEYKGLLSGIFYGGMENSMQQEQNCFGYYKVELI